MPTRVNAPDLARDLLQTAWADRLPHQSGGESVAHAKSLTLCLRKPWYERRLARTLGEESSEWTRPLDKELDSATLLKIMLGIGLGNQINPTEDRLTIPTQYGLISGRADLVQHDHGIFIPGEIKTTWAPKDSGLQPQYEEQVCAYCLGLNTNYCRLYIVRPFSPSISCTEIIFTDDELEAWHNELERRTEAVLADNPPSLMDHYAWECKGCQFWVNNGGTCPGGHGKYRGFFSPNGSTQ